MRNIITKKNMDLDLRRYGKMLYSKAEESGGSGGSDSGRVSIVDLFKEAVRERDEFDGSDFDSNMHYPDTFVYNDGNGYVEYPPSAGEVVVSPSEFFF